MANQEEILDALCSYEKKPSKDIPPVLEEFLRQVAKTGETIFPWPRLKPLFICKLDQVMEQFNQEVPYDNLLPYPNVENAKYEEMRARVIEAFEKFSGPPFTVQRICELVTEPRKHYKRSDKFLRGVEKNVMVVSTVDPFGKKIAAEPPRGLMNGIEVNGFGKPGPDSDGNLESQPFPNLPPTTWPDSGSVSTIWPSVFPEQNVSLSEQNSSTNATPEPTQENIETQSSEMEVKLGNVLDRADNDKTGSDNNTDSEDKQEKQVVDSDLNTVNKDTSVSSDESDSNVNKDVVLTDTHSDSETVKQEKNVDTCEHSAEKTDDSTEDSVSKETNTLSDTAEVSSLKTEENEEQQHLEQTSDSKNDQDQDLPKTEENRSPSPEPAPTEAVDECSTKETHLENVEECRKEEESCQLQAEKCEPVINEENNETESVNESVCSSSNESTESETVHSETENVDQSDAEVVQKEAEAEEMESSSDENAVINTEVNESEVKDSDINVSSENMDVDSVKSEAHEESGSVTTSGQETEEPMDQE